VANRFCSAHGGVSPVRRKRRRHHAFTSPDRLEGGSLGGSDPRRTDPDRLPGRERAFVQVMAELPGKERTLTRIAKGDGPAKATDAGPPHSASIRCAESSNVASRIHSATVLWRPTSPATGPTSTEAVESVKERT
jgi:hypothetical protein